MFSFSDKNNEIVLIYDIGNASVGGALAIIPKSGKPKIIYASRNSVSGAGRADSAKLISAAGKSLETVSKDIEKNGLRHLKFTPFGINTPQKAFCILSSPWHVSQTRTVLLKKDKPFTATKKLLDELILDETNNFKRSPLVKEKINSDKNILIESETVQIKLNGYETNVPESKQATTLQVSAFLSLSPETVIDSFSEKIRKVFNLENISFNSFPLTAFTSIKKIFEKQDFIFVDISGETTDVSLAKNGALSEIVTFPIGKKSVIRELTDKLRTTPEEALSLFYLYQENKLSEEGENRVSEALIASGKNWLESFRNTLIEIGEGFSLPNTIFFTSDKDAETWFGNLMRKEDYSQFTLTESSFLIKPVDAQSLTPACDTDNSVKKDPFLAIGAIFAASK